MIKIFQFIPLIALVVLKCSGSALNGECSSNKECGTIDTFCNEGVCTCLEHFLPFDDNCIRLGHHNGTCTHKSKCKGILGSSSICRHGRCACKPFHHLHKGRCVKSKGLNEICGIDHECYCGEDCKNAMGCIEKFCTCLDGFKPYGRKCIPFPVQLLPEKESEETNEVSSSNFVSSTVVLVFSTVFLRFFV